MKISCIIVDDEPLAIRVVEKYVAELPFLSLQGQFDSPITAMRFLQQQPVDLIFLDIHMPELSGINLVKALSQPPLVIFTTAFPDYAVAGFELDAVDYLVKPFSKERFLKAVQKAGLLLEKKPGPEPASSPTHLTLKADRKIYRLPLDDIQYCQAYGDYVKIITTDKQLLPKITLAKLMEQLPSSRFIRVHRSYVIAWDKVEYLEGNQLKIEELLIPVGQQYREQVLKRLKPG